MKREAKARKKANGEGSIWKEATGKYAGRYRCRVAAMVNGKMRSLTGSAWSHKEILATLKQLQERVAAGGLDRSAVLAPDRVTVAGLIEAWLADHVTLKKSENTAVSYKFAADTHIIPRVGTVRLKEFAPLHAQQLVADWTREGVGSRALQNAFTVLRAAFTYARNLRLIDSDPFEFLEKPEHEAKDINPFTLEEARDLIAATIDDRHHVAVCLGIQAGLRQGEIFGLEWSKIDMKAATATIDQQAADISGSVTLKRPKTKASIRTVSLTPQTITALKAHKAILLKEGLASSKLVLPAPEGGLISRNNFRTRFWIPLLDRLGLARRGFHHTRHSYATLSLGAGIPVTVVSKQLGHAKTSTTLDIYSHVLETHQTSAVETLSRLFG